MSYACSYEVPADENVYRKVKAEIGEQEPKGLVVHLVAKSDTGLRHITVWDSQADWERFRDERVQPAVGRVLSAVGFAQQTPAPPEEELEIVDVIVP